MIFGSLVNNNQFHLELQQEKITNENTLKSRCDLLLKKSKDINCIIVYDTEYFGVGNNNLQFNDTAFSVGGKQIVTICIKEEVEQISVNLIFFNNYG